MRWAIFAKRNFKEIIRDPLSYIFGLGLPLVMLVVMTVINEKIPPEANMTLFKIENLSCGIAVFSLTFTMLCTAMLVSKDRSGAFLQRLYSSPMTGADYIIGYVLPMLAVAVVQLLSTFVFSAVIGAITDAKLQFVRVLGAFLSLLPMALTLVSLGIALGFLLGQNAAPPACSIIITLSGLLGGIWFDSSLVGGGIEAVCKILPFLNGVNASRAAMVGDAQGVWIPLLITVSYAIGALVLAFVAFRLRRKKV